MTMTDPTPSDLRLLDLHLTDALTGTPSDLEPMDCLMAGGIPEDLRLTVARLEADYLDDGIPYPYSGDHITTTKAGTE